MQSLLKKNIKIPVMVLIFLFLYNCMRTTSYYVAPQEENKIRGARKIIVVLNDGTEWVLKKPGIAGNKLIGITKNNNRKEIETTSIESVRIIKSPKGVFLYAGVAIVTALLGFRAATAPAPPETNSCPFIYSYDGKYYAFDAEPFGAAVSRGLKRTEWCELEHLREVNGQYKLLVTNELDETQYIDELKLIVVDHPAGTRVAPDTSGGIHTISAPTLPIQAYSGAGDDLAPIVSEKDGKTWQSRFSDRIPDRKEDLKDELIFDFPKPEGAKKAKLLVNACTSLWGASMGKRFISLYGNKVSSWYDEIDNFGPAYYRILSWYMNEELYLLKIRVQTAKGWETRGMILGAGPMSSKDKVYLLDVSDIPGDTLRIKLTPPLNFWAIDYLAVDYSDDLPINSTVVTAVKAIDHKGNDVREYLKTADNDFYTMPIIGDSVDLRFPVPPSRVGMERTVILQAGGYYKIHIDDVSGEPRMDIIERFHTEPGYTIRFAQEEYLKWKKENESRVDKQ